MKEIPEWQYPLYKRSDKSAYAFLKKLGTIGRYPELLGTRIEKSDFLRLLPVSQKMKDYRKFRDDTLREFRKDTANIPKLIRNGKKLGIRRGNVSWAMFRQDRRICELIDDVRIANVQYSGQDRDISEFVVRFWLSQLFQDWRGPLMALLLEFRSGDTIRLSKLNRLLKRWDYTGIFSRSR